jgi:hypothetical protein
VSLYRLEHCGNGADWELAPDLFDSVGLFGIPSMNLEVGFYYKQPKDVKSTDNEDESWRISIAAGLFSLIENILKSHV